MIVTVANPEQFTNKGKLITYIRGFVELYNWRNHGQVHEIYGIVEFEKMYTLTIKHLRNFSAHRIIKISWILRSTCVVPQD